MNQATPQERTKLELSDLAKPSCPKCYGRGYTGIDYNTQLKIPCGCALKNYAQVRKALVARLNAEQAAQASPTPPPPKKGFFARIREKLRI